MQIAGISRTTFHRSLIPLDGLQQRMFFMLTLNTQATGEMLHPIPGAQQKGTARGRPNINPVTPRIIVSAGQLAHLCPRQFRCPQAGHWDGPCVSPWATFFPTCQIAPA